MPQFFLPGTEDAQEAENVLAAIAKFVRRPVPKRRLFRVAYTHNGRNMVAEIGEEPDPYYCESGPVIAIFDGDPLLVCLPNRGVIRGEPIYVGYGCVSSRSYFGDETTH